MVKESRTKYSERKKNRTSHKIKKIADIERVILEIFIHKKTTKKQEKKPINNNQWKTMGFKYENIRK